MSPDLMLRTLFDQEQRIEIEFPEMAKEILPHVVRFTRPAPGMSFILYSSLEATNADTVIAEQVEYFRQLERPFNWKVYDYDQPPDLGQRLLAHGFVADEPEAVMLLDIQDEDALPVQNLPEMQGVKVRRIEQREQLGEVIQVLEAVYGAKFDWVWERLGGNLEVPGYLSVYLAEVDGQPASCAWTYFHPGSPFASLWGGSTIETQRGKGLYSALLSTRILEARQRGVRYLVVDCSPMSQPIVTRFGFKFFATAQDYEWKPEKSVER